tara:strand:+ start:57 stop:911 length:855 start_codon:yes stop_codon:yes gene_type:complete
MDHLKIFINLTRLNKPIGYMLLFWPCSWGLAYAHKTANELNIFLYYLFLFFLGSILMRSAGCIVNDIIDQDLDKKVKRTKNRPLASGDISNTRAIIYSALLCFISFFILIQFNFKTIFLGLSSMILAFTYPFMKRFTYWPQLFLGLTFNWGMIMAYTAILDQISIEIMVLYISAIFWTLGYDTIYGVQDVADDEIIGVKSTAIKFKKNIKLFVSICYLISSLLIIITFADSIKINFSTLFMIMFILSLIYQLKIFNKDNPNTCLKAFKINNFSGIFLLASILMS